MIKEKKLPLSASYSDLPLYPDTINLVNWPMESKAQSQTGVSFEELLTSVGQHRDKEAFIALFEYFAPRIKSFLMKANLTPEQADDLAQDTMVAVWDKAATYNAAKAAASTWIFTIARNKRIDVLRKTGKQTPVNYNVESKAAESLQPDEVVTQHEQQARIQTALKDLPVEQAQLIEKAYFEEKTHKAIAEETKLPLGTVKSRIRLGLERLRHELGGQIL